MTPRLGGASVGGDRAGARFFFDPDPCGCADSLCAQCAAVANVHAISGKQLQTLSMICAAGPAKVEPPPISSVIPPLRLFSLKSRLRQLVTHSRFSLGC